jgi:octaprenyl-diphosphate synthase
MTSHLAWHDLTSAFELVAAEMADLDRELAKALACDHSYLKELHRKVLDNPGKRLRPALLFLCCRLLGYRGNTHITFAAVLELIHTATLVHDDVIDGAFTRRGKATLNEFGRNTMSVLYGDWLYTRANSMAIRAGNLELMHILSTATELMVEGELLQERVNFQIQQDQGSYFEILNRKTASLFAATTEIAAVLADCPSAQRQALREFGCFLGISFQLIDDYLDFMESEANLGKPVLADLAEGKLTLPMLLWIEKVGQPARDLVGRVWSGDGGDPLAAILSDLAEKQILEKVRTVGIHYASEAIKRLKLFPESPLREVLARIPILMANRRR